MLMIRGVNVFPSQIESVLMQHEPASARTTRSSCAAKGYTDTLEVQVELVDGKPAGSATATWRSCSRQHPRQARAPLLGIDAQGAPLCQPNTLKRFEGKAKRVTDLRK